MKLLFRITAAIAAFKDPALIGEAKGIRSTLDSLSYGNEFVLLSGEYYKNHMIPRIDVLTYEQRQRIRRILGEI